LWLVAVVAVAARLAESEVAVEAVEAAFSQVLST
jgi:hypothetical protein